jgi:hypothetical protein
MTLFIDKVVMDDNNLRKILHLVCRFLLSSAIGGGVDPYRCISELPALSFSASPVADIDQDEGSRSAGAVEYPVSMGERALPRRMRPHA